jgi:hypothetical protein
VSFFPLERCTSRWTLNLGSVEHVLDMRLTMHRDCPVRKTPQEPKTGIATSNYSIRDRWISRRQVHSRPSQSNSLPLQHKSRYSTHLNKLDQAVRSERERCLLAPALTQRSHALLLDDLRHPTRRHVPYLRAAPNLVEEQEMGWSKDGVGGCEVPPQESAVSSHLAVFSSAQPAISTCTS